MAVLFTQPAAQQAGERQGQRASGALPAIFTHPPSLQSICHDSSRVSAMPTSRAYDTRYAILLNMLTHDSHGLHAVIINMDLRVHGHVLYKRRHACSTTTNGCLG